MSNEIFATQTDIDKIRGCLESCKNSPMRQPCIEKAIILIEGRLDSQQQTSSARIELMMMKLKEEIRLMIEELLKRNKENGREQIRWGFEVVKFIVYMLPYVAVYLAIKS